MEIAILAFLLAIALSMVVPFFSLAPWLPIPEKDVGRVLDLARLGTGDRFYDLGCGDGRVVLAAAARGAQAVGLEISFAMWLVCRIRRVFDRKGDAKFRLKDLFAQDLSDADAVYVYGTTATNARLLKPKLEAELKPGARVVTYAFRIDGWEPAAVDGNPPRERRIYLYIR